jgi:tRNA dimethylallyltransferase
MRPRIVALVGATATGKTALGEALAEALSAEIVCADSRQVFRELDAGTGKPTPAERAARPHHVFDALELGARASAGWYARAAGEACAAVLGRGRTPLLVGGSGLYVRALQTGLSAEPPHDPELRERLRVELEASGPEALHRRLLRLDPITAARLTPRDRQRITRALEVFEASGRPLSWWHARPTTAPLAAEWAVLELVVAPRHLSEAITRRTRAMFAGGLVEETRRLVVGGHEAALRRLRAVGYDEALELIAGRIGREEAEARTDARTRRLAKRQRTWFRHQIEATRLESAAEDSVALLGPALAALAATAPGIRPPGARS